MNRDITPSIFFVHGTLHPDDSLLTSPPPRRSHDRPCRHDCLCGHACGGVVRSQCGLFVYDVFWVFGTDVMVSVATKFDAPIKLIFPRAPGRASTPSF